MKKFINSLIIILVFLFVSGLLIIFFLPMAPLLNRVSFSKAVYDDHHQLLRMTLSQDEKYRIFTPLTALPKNLIDATLLQEDQYFYHHYGINPVSMVHAIWQTYGFGSRRIGASTITMQLARLRFSIYSKTISGKLLQMMRAVQIEMHFTKDEILEAYLNLVPYGGNIEGAGAASLIYFKHKANKITLPEALTLSVIPQHPAKRTPGNTHLKAIRNALFIRWLRMHPEDFNQSALFNLPIVMHSVHFLPFIAPHFVNQVLNHASLDQYEINTSLDVRMQYLIERITTGYLARKQGLGINNAAVMLLDARTMAIKGLMGSGNFFNEQISGQINGTEIKRSPGSTLKPFIYGLALDQGLIHPNTVLKDVPHSFNGYNPENFDYDFMGPIHAKDALVLSRNIPAVFLSQLLNPGLHHLLEQAQVTQLRPESYYGLSLNLGGIELTLRELISLYAMLVNEGLWYPVEYSQLSNQSKQKGIRLLSPEASFLVLDMLNNTPRHGLGEGISSRVPMSWKTGTSSGYRDAWTIGSFGPYVLAVWIGNFDNRSNAALIGKDIAAPLFFQLSEAIIHEQGSRAFVEPEHKGMNLKKVKVCKASGLLPTRYCTDREWTWFIPGKSPIKTDTIFREVAINAQSGKRTCHINEYTRFEIFEFWPSDLLSIFKKAGIQRHTPPFFEAGCDLSTIHGLSPQITSPKSGLRYVVRANSTLNNTIPLSAVTDAGIEFVYWFINETFIAKTKANQIYFWPAKPGKFVVRVVDNHGLSDARDVKVLMDIH